MNVSNPPIPRPHGQPLSEGRGLLLVIVVALAFFGAWWNRYVPPTTDGESVMMSDWGANFLPYRDYFFQGPPGWAMLVRGIIAVGGPHLFATLGFGVLLRTAGACALYGLMLRVSRPSYAALATLTGLFVSSTDISDTPFYYNHIGTALVLIGTYLCLLSAHRFGFVGRSAGAIGAALLTYAVAVKQTMLLGSAAACVALVLFAWPRPRVGWIAWVTGLTAGVFAAVTGIWAWLYGHDLLEPFFFVMTRAPEGKGGIARSLLRPLSLLPFLPQSLVASQAAWIVIAVVAGLVAHQRRNRSISHGVRLTLGSLVVIVLGVVLNFHDTRVVTLFLTALGWWGGVALAVLYLRSFKEPSTSSDRSIVALGVLSFGIGYCFTVSWPLFENAALPGLAVVVGVMLERPPSVRRATWVWPLMLLAGLSMGLSVYRKFTFPHAWGDWVEPPLYSARGDFDHRALVGLRISRNSADLFSAVAKVARTVTQPDDPIYVYPNLPILYAMAERRPATYAMAHWVDICPDFLGKEDAERLRLHPPKLMILREYPMRSIEVEEIVYRGGERSSVRDIIAAIEAIKPLYDKTRDFTASSIGTEIPVSIYVRKDVSRAVNPDVAQ